MVDEINPKKYSAFVLIHPLLDYIGAPTNSAKLVEGLPEDLLNDPQFRMIWWRSMEDVSMLLPDRIDFLKAFKRVLIAAWVKTAKDFVNQGKQVILFLPESLGRAKLLKRDMPKELVRMKGVEIVKHLTLKAPVELFDSKMSQDEIDEYFSRISRELASSISDSSNILIGGLFEEECYWSIVRALIEETDVKRVTVRTDLTDRLKLDVAMRTQSAEWIATQARNLGELDRWIFYEDGDTLCYISPHYEWTLDKKRYEQAANCSIFFPGHGAKMIATPFVEFIQQLKQPRGDKAKHVPLEHAPREVLQKERTRKR